MDKCRWVVLRFIINNLILDVIHICIDNYMELQCIATQNLPFYSNNFNELGQINF